MIRRLGWSEIEKIYSLNMQEDFPAGELKSLKLLKSLYDKGSNAAYGLYDDEQKLKAYAIFEKPDKGNVWLLDYLAVNSSARGGGFGSRFLKEIGGLLEGVDSVMAEIERIEMAQDDVQREIRERRKRFYLKNGLIETGVYTNADADMDYEILCLPVKKQVSGKEAAEAMKNIYDTFFEPGTYEIFG